MKRKFILYPAVALALMTSASLSSCVDTDEPDSIAELRKAVSQEVQANAGLLNAKAAVENAYVAVVNANAREAEAKAAKAEYEALCSKQFQELDAIKKKLEGDSLSATAQQQLDEAKARWDAKVADAKAQYEEKNAAYQAAIEKAKLTVQEAKIDVQVKMARNAAEGLNDTLTTLADTYTDKLDALTKAKKALDDCFVDNYGDTSRASIEAPVIAKQLAFSNAKSDLETFNTFKEEKGIDAFGALYKEYQLKVNAVDAKTKELEAVKVSLEKTKEVDLDPVKKATAEALAAADKAYNDKKTALNEDFDKKIKALKEGKVEAGKVTFACSNTKLVNELIDASKIGDFRVTDNKDGYVNTAEIEGQKSEEAVKKLKETVNAVYVDLLNDYARKIQAMKDKAAANLTDATKAMNTAKTAWQTAVDKYRAKVTDAGLESDLIEKAKELFGDYADNDKGGNWKWFSNKSAFVSDATEMKQLLKNAGITNPDWGKMGKYGDYQSAVEGANTSMIDNVLDDAKKLLDAIDAKVNEYKNALKGLEDGKKGIEGTDEMKKLAETKNAAKKADDDAQKALDDWAAEFKKQYTDASKDILDQKAKDQAMADKYFEFAKAINDKLSTDDADKKLTDADKESVYKFENLVAYVTKILQNAVDAAQEEYDKANQDLIDYDDHTFDPKKKKKDLEDAVEKAQKEADKAKRDYDNMLAYYGN